MTPPNATFLRFMRASRDSFQVRTVLERLRGVFELFVDAATGSTRLAEAETLVRNEDWRAVANTTNAHELFQTFFRKLNGFACFLMLEDLDQLVAYLASPSGPSADWPLESGRIDCLVRRVKWAADDGDDSSGLQIELEPIGNYPRLLVRCRVGCIEGPWPATVARCGLLERDRLEIPSEWFTTWPGKALTSLLRGYFPGWDPDRAECLPSLLAPASAAAGQAPNPLPYLRDFLQGSTLQQSRSTVRCVWSGIHADLHLENILTTNSEHKVIDLASMQFGPLEYDLARVQSSLLLDLEIAANRSIKSVPVVAADWAEIAQIVERFLGEANGRPAARQPSKLFRLGRELTRLRASLLGRLKKANQREFGPQIFENDSACYECCLFFELASEAMRRARAQKSVSEVVAAFVGASLMLDRLIRSEVLPPLKPLPHDSNGVAA